MLRRGLAAVLLVGLTSAPATAQSAPTVPRPVVRVIGETTIVGESDPAVWKSVLDLLPARPHRVELFDLDSASDAVRAKLRGLDAFVLTGHSTIVVIRQSATLRLAETGDAMGRLALASLVWHELAHVDGLDERGAFDREQALWRRFIASGLVDAGTAMTCIARLRDARARSAAGSALPTAKQ